MMKTLLALVGCILAVNPGESAFFGINLGFDLGSIFNFNFLDWGFGFKLPTFKRDNYNWAVLMQRIDGGTLDFYRGWNDYANGFQDQNGKEFWVGNEKIYTVTNKRGTTYTLRVEVQVASNGNWYYAEYSSFYLEPKSNGYAIHVSGYSGNAGDSLSGGATDVEASYNHNGMAFSTGDADNDRSTGNCADFYKGGWWFNNCYQSCLTCPRGDTFVWSYTKNWPSSGPLKAAIMMIRKN